MTVRIKALDAEFGVAPQPLPSDMDDIRRAGYKSIVDARPDNEDAGQPSFDEIAVAAGCRRPSNDPHPGAGRSFGR